MIEPIGGNRVKRRLVLFGLICRRRRPEAFLSVECGFMVTRK